MCRSMALRRSRRCGAMACERTTTALDELRAQRLVAAENAVKARFQSIHVQRPIDTKRTR